MTPTAAHAIVRCQRPTTDIARFALHDSNGESLTAAPMLGLDAFVASRCRADRGACGELQCAGMDTACRKLTPRSSPATAKPSPPARGERTAPCCSSACDGAGACIVQCETNPDCDNGCNKQTWLCNAPLPIGLPYGSTAQGASGAQCLLDQSRQRRCCERPARPKRCRAMVLGRRGAGDVGDCRWRCAHRLSAHARRFDFDDHPSVDDSEHRRRLHPSAESARQRRIPCQGNCLNLVRQDGASCALTVSFAAIRRNSRGHADADGSATAAAALPGDLVAPNDVARAGKR
jgi:hypothetical protein